MRVFLVFTFLGLISGVGLGWWPNDERESAEMAEAMRLKAEAALGIRRMLRAHPDFEFRDVVVGRVLEGGHVDFRGQLQRKGRAKAVYGLVAVHCVDGLATAECWKLSYLEADGAMVALKPAAPPVLAERSTNVPDEPLQDETDGGSVVIQASTTGSIETSDTHSISDDPADQAEDDDVPSATHLVARPVINTRSGPGTDNPVLTRLNEGARLALINTKGAWGNFVILEGNAVGQEVWAALSLLEEATQ
ncbi:MAG: hypothetical protein AB8B85_07290 [Paracoccaceae bacterium]